MLVRARRQSCHAGGHGGLSEDTKILRLLKPLRIIKLLRILRTLSFLS